MFSRKHRFAVLTVIGAVGSALPAYGYEYRQGDFSMQIDSTVSIGASWRASDRDYRQVGSSNALAASDNPNGLMHLHGSSAQDDSNLLWKKGSTFSEIAKITIDLEMNYKNYGAFIRGKAFYDHRIVNNDGITDRPAFYWQDDQGNNLSPNQSDGRSADILDAFVWGEWWFDDKPLNVRLGKQVINWGEGLFFANGINSINPIDVGALLAPGSEVKDALIPLNALYASFGVTPSLTLEGFVLFEWSETELPACGTYFSVTDLAGPNCYAGFIPSGLESSHPSAAAVTLPRIGDSEPDDGGQFGIAARYFAESIETEFSVYYMNLHSRLPVISGHFADVDEWKAAYSAGIPAPVLPLINTLDDVRAFLVQNGPLGPLSTSTLLPFGDYYLEYVEDIPLLGASFNTTIDFKLPGGATAVSGEISMRKDQPFAREDGDGLAGAVGLPSLACVDAPRPYRCYSQYSSGDENKGYVEADYFQAELVFIHFFDQILGASRWTAILDIAGSYIDMPSKRGAILNSGYNATLNFPGLPQADYTTPAHPVFTPYPLPYDVIPYPTFVEGAAAPGTALAEESNYVPTSGAWGYKLRFAGEYNNVVGGLNLRPVISFSHDVYGTTPSPIANFLEDRKALGLSLEGIILNDYSVKFSYTDFYGAEPYNSLHDRDYYSLSATASF